MPINFQIACQIAWKDRREYRLGGSPGISPGRIAWEYRLGGSPGIATGRIAGNIAREDRQGGSPKNIAWKEIANGSEARRAKKFKKR